MEKKGDVGLIKNEEKEHCESFSYEIQYHKTDMVNYKKKYPDFGEALKGRKITLKTEYAR